MNEGMNEGWAKLVLAVDLKTGEFHAIGGDREPGEGDRPWPALEVLKAKMQRRPSSLPQNNRAYVEADVRLLAHRCGASTRNVKVAVGEDSTVYFNPEEMRHWAEEYEATMMALDLDKVPQHDAEGKVYSLYGRVCRKAQMAVENDRWNSKRT